MQTRRRLGLNVLAVPALAVAALAASLGACDRSRGSAVPGPAGAAGPGAADATQTSQPIGFVDVAQQAGVSFKMAFLPGEQGRTFKINLYDHGTGVALADIDGDGDDDIYFLNQLGPNALYRNDGAWHFTDITAAAGLLVDDRVCAAAVFGDVDGDGDQDLYVTSTRGGNLFFKNDGRGHFTDATAAAGLTLVAHSAAPAMFDYDADGDLDLFVTNTARWTLGTRDPSGRYFEGPSGLGAIATSVVEHDILYRNDGNGAFTDVTEAAGVAGDGWGFDTAVIDFDEDGRPDLFVGNMLGVDRLFHNKGDGTFENVTSTAFGGRTSWGTTGVKAFDYDGDGRLDLMAVDMHSDMWLPISLTIPPIEEHRKYKGLEGPAVERGFMTSAQSAELNASMHPSPLAVFGNTLHRNLGGGRFEEVSDKAGVETFWPWGIAPADFDCDGDQDVFVPSGMGYPLFYWRSSFLVNRSDGTFEDHSRIVGIDPLPGGSNAKELIDGMLAPRSQRAAAVSDLDGDGRPDLVVVNFNDHPFVLRNTFPARSWVELRLHGTRSNRDAIGAVVTIRAGGKRIVRQVETASGYLAQSTKTLHFGLGDAKSIDSCEIRWPNGSVQKLDGLKLGVVTDVTEPADTPK
ncbi:MAG: CRTAC1 family protein [Planctomycetes bacterium]|nr:CRTAC1 family protein [Planctomycetota bacterium]